MSPLTLGIYLIWAGNDSPAPFTAEEVDSGEEDLVMASLLPWDLEKAYERLVTVMLPTQEQLFSPGTVTRETAPLLGMGELLKKHRGTCLHFL